MDFGEFLKQLGLLADKDPAARAFILVLMAQLLLLGAFMMLGIRGFIQRRRQADAESDADVTPKDNTIAVLTQILAKTADNATRLTDRVEQLEAQNAGVTAKLETVIQVDRQFLEALNSLTVASQQLLKVAGGIRTREEAEEQTTQAVQAIKAELAPVLTTTAKTLDHLTAQSVTVGAIDGKADALLTKADEHHDALKGMPDALLLKIKDSRILQEAFAAIEERAKQAEAARDMLAVKINLLNAENADLTEKLRIALATIAALPKVDPLTAAPTVTISADTSKPPSADVPPAAPEGVVLPKEPTS